MRNWQVTPWWPGEGRHAAALNLGDTYSYALARRRQCRLLFFGDDFTQTDVATA